MASKGGTQVETASPAPSLVSYSRRRRGSTLSVASQIDREALNQALDHIHNTASQSDTLTTFNEYTPPPSNSTSVGNEVKGIAADLQGGLSGLYSRFKASVGSTKDNIILNTPSDGADDAASVKSSKPASSTPASTPKPVFKASNAANSVSSLLSQKLEKDSIEIGKVQASFSGASRGTAAYETGISRRPGSIQEQASALKHSSIHPKAPANITSYTKAGSSTQVAPDSLRSPGLPSHIEIKGLSDTKDKPLGSPGIAKPLSISDDRREKLTEKASTPTEISSRSKPAPIPSHHRDQSSQLSLSEGSEKGNTIDDPFLPDGAAMANNQAATNISRDQIGSQRHLEHDSNPASRVRPSESLKRPVLIHQTKAMHASDLSADESAFRSYQSLQNSRSSRASSVDSRGLDLTPQSSDNILLEDPEASEVAEEVPTQSLPSTKSVKKRGMSVVTSQIRNRVLSRAYWMKDENARDCFHCGTSFSTFRRKHHCRTCGQIFDAKCTSLVSGGPFGQSGTIRVCKPCEIIINGYDDSSEYSDEDGVASIPRPRPEPFAASSALPRSETTAISITSDNRDDVIPTMAIPATRRVADDSKRRSAVVEIDAEPRLVRPSSSRSLKSTLSSRPHTAGHRRHHSRSLLQKSTRNNNEERAPFHRSSDDPSQQGSRLPAFHSDNVIDPELAAYMSDEGSSGEEHFSLLGTINNERNSKPSDHDKNSLSGFLASARKRSRLGENSVSGLTTGSRDPDTVSINSGRMGGNSRNSRRRNLSASGNFITRSSPRTYRFSAASPAFGSHIQEVADSQNTERLDSPSGKRMIRSSSMSGPNAPTVELNNASIQHVRRLLSQLLNEAEIQNVGSWEKALMPILLQAADNVNPDVHNGDDMDLRHYVKLKKIAGGKPGDTSYVSGLVFTKNLALKSMPRSIPHPNILILTFPLEYSRREEHFMSLEPVIRQEREYLQNLVHRIAALRPHLLLVQRNVSGLALQFLEDAQIATAYNVKISVLEAIARCAQTRIIHSIDRLAVKQTQAGTCDAFYLKTYMYGDRKKTYMFLSGCPKELGCTIVLRGGNEKSLSRIKRITEFMIYVVYNLKLETCLMRDEFALIPTYTGVGTISLEDTWYKGSEKTLDSQVGDKLTSKRLIKNASPTDHALISDSQRTESIASVSISSVSQQAPREALSSDEMAIPEGAPTPTFYSDLIERFKEQILSVSPFVKFAQPYLLMRAREQEQRIVYLKGLRDRPAQHEAPSDGQAKSEKFVLITPEMIHGSIDGASKKVQEVLHAVQDAEYEKAVHNYRTQKKQWESYFTLNNDMFNPFSHQNIAVLYSVVCTVTSVPCAGPDILALEYYNEHESDDVFEADCTLGQYVEHLCLSANSVCIANGCEKKMLDHHRQYVHGNAQISAKVEHCPSKLAGYQDIILMWSICRLCGKETQISPMSDSTWKYSFGKYLELSIWSTKLQARAGICSHDLHRSHTRFFGFKNMAVRIQYDPVNLLEIIVPRTRITWKVVNDLKFKNDVYKKAEDRLNRYMMSVKCRIKNILTDSVAPEKMEACKQEIERLIKLANEDHVFLTRKLQEKYMGSTFFEIIPFNRAIRALQEKVAEWDIVFTSFDHNFFPSEKDIRRLATLQLRKIFLDRDDSMTSLSSNEEKTSDSIPSGLITEKTSPEEPPTLIPQTRNMSTEKARDMLTTVLDNQNQSPKPKEAIEQIPFTEGSTVNNAQSQMLSPLQTDMVQHLDLAIPCESPESEKPSQSLDPDSQSTVSSQNLKDADKPEGSQPPDAGPSGETSSPPMTNQESQSFIPRPSEIHAHRTGLRVPVLQRARSQPARAKRDSSNSSGSGSTTTAQSPLSQGPVKTHEPSTTGKDHALKHGDKKLTDRLGLGALKAGVNTHSMIPRSIVTRHRDTKVSTLAKHFEQLSREFEKERLRDRKQRATKNRRARAYPMAASKPIIEEYYNLHDAVTEKENSEEDSERVADTQDHAPNATAIGMAQNNVEQTEGEGFHAEETQAKTVEVEDKPVVESRDVSDIEDTVKSDDEKSVTDETPSISDSQTLLTSSEASLDLKIDLPKHEKSSLMNMLTKFWAERSASGWQPLEYPLQATDHVFADSDIIIREDEPSSLIAFALDSEDYKAKLQSIKDKSANSELRHDKPYVDDLFLTAEDQRRIERSLLQSTGTHLKYQFQEGSAKMLCKIFYAEQFDAVRRKCGVDNRIVESLSRCLKWDSKGGKTKSVFLKTLDDRLVLKSLSNIETQAFLRFAPAYFELMGEALFHELPSVIAKMVGFYQIVIKNPVTGVEFNWFLLVMENLFYDRAPTRIFDLKGSMRNRRIQSTGEQNEVLLDENMVEFIYETPLFTRDHSKRLLSASVFNDTLFLSRQNVMDYSLMVAIDEVRSELVVGTIDCIRTYTWDKKLESWMKDRGKNRPTVTSPREYKNRFREAMGRYILQAPTCWHQYQLQHEVRRPQVDPSEPHKENVREAQVGDSPE